jgi:tripartite-type tricarboxylate transporter receptor subunit TctC
MVRLTLVLGLATTFCSVAHAQPAAPDPRWPDRPIHVIVPFQPGGVADVVMRVVGKKLGEHLGQQIVVENRAAASGRIGTEAVARAEPDGYTLGFANSSTHALAPTTAENLGYDPVKDFAPVAMIGNSPFVLTVYPGLPARTLPELVALAKSRPRVLRYSSAGTGTLSHFAGVLLERLANIEMIHVPYRGTNQAMVDLMEGRIEAQFGTIPPTLQYIRNGRMRALAVTGSWRSQSLPDVPTVAQSGITDYDLSLWQAIVAPAAVSPGIIARLNREIVRILDEPDTIEALNKLGVEPDPGTPEALGRRISVDISKWRSVVNDTKSR